MTSCSLYLIINYQLNLYILTTYYQSTFYIYNPLPIFWLNINLVATMLKEGLIRKNFNKVWYFFINVHNMLDLFVNIKVMDEFGILFYPIPSYPQTV